MMFTKKIGLYTEATYSSKFNSIHSSDIFLLFIRQAFPKNEIHLIGRYFKDNKEGKYKLQPGKEHFSKLSYYKNIAKLIMQFPYYIFINYQVIKFYIKKIDHLLIAVPSPLSLYLVYLAKKNNKTISIFIRQETVELIRHRYPKSKLPLITALFLEKLLTIFLKRNQNIPVFTFGTMITEKYKKITSNVIPIADTRYSLNDIISESDIKRIDWQCQIKLIFVGRIEKAKGIENLLETLKRIKEYNFHLTIVGDGNFKSEYSALTKKLEINNNVSFTGFIPYGENLLSIIKEHDIFILPSLSEGLPQVILEAMACGILVLASNVGGIPLIVKNGFNGFTFNPNSDTELKEIILNLKESKFDNLLICREALKTASQYSSESQISILLNNMDY